MFFLVHSLVNSLYLDGSRNWRMMVKRMSVRMQPLASLLLAHDSLVSAKLFSSTTDKLDLVLFVGPPASGKSSLFRHFFADRAYERVNQDTLKTAARCLTEARSLLGQGRSVVVDNTNRNVSTRAQYIHLAREFDNVRVRCIFFDVNKEVCWHNNLYRVRAGLVSQSSVRGIHLISCSNLLMSHGLCCLKWLLAPISRIWRCPHKLKDSIRI